MLNQGAANIRTYPLSDRILNNHFVPSSPLIREIIDFHLPERPHRINPHDSARLAKIDDLKPLITRPVAWAGQASLPFAKLIVEAKPDGSKLALFETEGIFFDQEARSRHILTVGPTGSGKTTRLILPLLKSDLANPDKGVVVIDGKGGDLVPYVVAMMERYRPGQQLKVLDFTHPERSICWNPAARSNTASDFHSLAHDFCQATTTNSRAQDSEFWIRNSVDILSGLLGTLRLRQNEECSLRRVYQLLQLPLSQLKNFVQTGPYVESVMASIHFVETGSHNAYTCLADLRSRLGLMIDERIATVTGKDQLNLDEFVQSPSVLVLRLSEEQVRKLRPLTNLFVGQLMSSFMRLASEQKGGALPHRFSWYIEELASAVGRVPDLENFVNTVRSRGLEVVGSVQSITQIDSEYGMAALPLLAGFGTKIFTPGLTLDDTRYASSLAGTSDVAVNIRFKSGGSSGVALVGGGSDESERSASSGYIRTRCPRDVLTTSELRLPMRDSRGAGAFTLFCGEAPPFQAFLTPFYSDPDSKEIADIAQRNSKLGPEVRNKSPSPVSFGSVEAESWWAGFKALLTSEQRQDVAEQLAKRGVTFEDLRMAQLEAKTDSIPVILALLDFRLAQGGNSKTTMSGLVSELVLPPIPCS